MNPNYGETVTKATVANLVGPHKFHFRKNIINCIEIINNCKLRLLSKDSNKKVTKYVDNEKETW